jgi:hypothetical protein
MSTDHGGVYFPQGPVRIVLGDDYNNGYLDLATPDKGGRKLDWGKRVVTKEGLTGKLKSHDKGYRPTLRLVWSAPSDAIISKLIKLSAYKGDVTVFPFFTGTVGVAFGAFGFTLRMKVITVDIEPFGDQSIYGKFTFVLEATRYYDKPFDPDDLNFVVKGRVRAITGTDHFIRPQTRHRGAGGSPACAVEHVIHIHNTVN